MGSRAARGAVVARWDNVRLVDKKVEVLATFRAIRTAGQIMGSATVMSWSSMKVLKLCDGGIVTTRRHLALTACRLTLDLLKGILAKISHSS